MIWHALRTAWRLGLAAFFRRIEVAGRENLPPAGPLLLVPNHTNAFVDAFMVATVVPRRVTLTAKSTLFGHPALRVLLWAADAVALHRQQDRDHGADPAANLEALAECRRRLSRGEAICIFPEGVSHSDGRLRPLRTGAARIALDFTDKGSGALTIVPVGLHYEAKEKFRSAVWVRFGAPIDASAWRRAHPEAGPRELSAEIEQRLRALTLNFRLRREAVLLQWTAEVLATRGLPPPVLGREGGAVAERAILAGLLSEGYEKLEASHGDEIAELEDRVRRYHGDLRRLGISPPEVYLEMNAGRAALFVVREVETLVIGLPLALLGTLLHGPAYVLSRAVVYRISIDRDHWATNAVGIGSILILLSSTIELAAAWIFLSWPFALALTALLPYSGYYALLYRDRAGGILRRSRTFLRFLFDQGLQQRLAKEGRAIIAGIERLAEAIPA
jgi:glycerol-3-phosphate O-acyltransferase / dihydroxyacetone phosphate acyltransferase